MNKAIILVGPPCSGKDFLLRSVLGNRGLVEISLDKFSAAASSKQDLTELANFPSLIINGNAEHNADIAIASKILETMEYETSMLYVYTTDQVSKERNDVRRNRGNKTFSEEQRQGKYNDAISCLPLYEAEFKPFWLFNNSVDINNITEEVSDWLAELTTEVNNFLGELEKPFIRSVAPKPIHPVPKTSVQHQSTLKGYERVKDHTGKWVLRRKPTTESAKYNSLNIAFENYSATAVDNSRGNTRVSDNGSPTENPATVMAKVLTPRKKIPGQTNDSGSARSDVNRADPPVWESTSVDQKVRAPTQKREDKKNNKTKGAPPPPDFFDGRMGAVPSGSLGITAEFKPSGTPLSELRKRMRK